MVMPRAFSSGALSISSNGVYGLSAGILSCSTLVIAAVSVVLPWSMCPMVPMLTCGLVRSNFAFATGVLLDFLVRTRLGSCGVAPQARNMAQPAREGHRRNHSPVALELR